jgi:hypothetical protein
MGRLLQLAGLSIGATGLVIQAAITIPASMEAGRSLGASVVFLLSFFTILTNIAALLVHAACLFDAARRSLSFYARPRVRAGVMVAMTVVFIVYVTVLAPIWAPEGLFLLCDILLHHVTPVIFVTWWLFYGRDGSARWRDIPLWLIYPLAYLVYAMLRAPIAGEVPYPFLDVARNGVQSVAVAAFFVLLLFVAVGSLAVLADTRLPARRVSA